MRSHFGRRLSGRPLIMWGLDPARRFSNGLDNAGIKYEREKKRISTNIFEVLYCFVCA